MTKNPTASLYRTLWRWHFYAGIFCLPFVLLLAISGTVYLFKPQWEAWRDAPYRDLATLGTTTAEEQIAIALAYFPDHQFVNYRLPQTANEAVIVTLQKGDEPIRVYVHPSTLEILHSAPVNSEFMQLIKRFHGELLAGDVGSVLVELAGCWAIVLVLTGLYLWWPRNAHGMAGILYPRLRQGARIFWRDVHAVTGFGVAGFTLFLLISGLPWSLVWGSVLKELRQMDSHAQHQTHSHAPHQMSTQDWSLRSNEHHHSTPHHLLPYLPQALVENARALQFAPPVELSPAQDRPGTWAVKSQAQNRPLRADAWLDATTGEVLEIKTFAQRKPLDRVIGVGIAAHEGQLFGWLNQLLGVFTTVGLSLMCISAFVLWRRRKPLDALGAPPALPDRRTGTVVSGIFVLLALLLPLLAASLLFILLLEWLILRRVHSARQWLGLAKP